MNPAASGRSPGTSPTASRAQLANLFAIYDEDPTALDAAERKLQRGGQFTTLQRPVPGWIAGWAPLPGTTPEGDAAKAAGLLFAEGRDRLEPGPGNDALQRFLHIATLVDGTPERLSELPGDFGFIRFRADGGVTVVCSCAGLVPFYWWQRGSSLAIGTRLGDFARYLPGPFKLNPLLNAVAAAGGTHGPGYDSYLAGVFRIPHGSYAVLARGGNVTVRGYWDPQPRRLVTPTQPKMRDHEERLHGLLLARLERDLDPTGGNLLTLSGGVDSSALAALASGTLGLPLWAWSFLPGPAEPFEHEMSYVRPLIEAFNIDRHWIRRAEVDTRLTMMPHAPHVLYPIPHPALCDLPAIQREADVRVLVGGEFADNILGGYEATADWAEGTSPFALARIIATRPARWRVAKRWARFNWQSLTRRPAMPQPGRLQPFVRSELQAEYHAWYRQRELEIAREKRPLRLLMEWVREDGWVTMNWEATSALGIRRSLPFYNREMLELAFELHPCEWGLPGEKKLERSALRHHVPTLNLQRPDKGHWGSYLAKKEWLWHGVLPEALHDVVREDWYPNPPAQLPVDLAAALMQLVLFANALAAANQEAIATDPG